MVSTTTNRLIHEKSPYLLQHARNPVDWFPWGDEAFARARTEDRPIFLSIGYATCHWCHVMERESFEHPDIAKLLNEWFVPVKVDREERPDVDRLYMTAVQAMGVGGGWPLSVFLTPDLRPFYGGTYFPPASRHGRAGFPDLLRRIHELWTDDRAKILESAEGITRFLQETPLAGGGDGLPGREVCDLCYEQLRSTYDPVHGGFGSGPKFPRPVVLHFLMRHGTALSVEMVTTTLRRMASGGMYDHVGGGFHRYAVDGEWRVPHFEKMLYDQAQLASAYLEAYQLTREPLFASVARGTLDYVLRDMHHPGGGFASAEDADSRRPENPGESGEGAFYVWSHREVMEVLGPDLGEIFCFAFGVKEEGNVEQDPHREFEGLNILALENGPEAVAAKFGVSPAALVAIMDEARERLLRRRNGRPRPLRDDKVLAGWNGLMISAFALAARVLGDDRYEQAARNATTFIDTHLRDERSGGLLRRYRDGESRFEGNLDDHAFTVQALIDLYQTTGETAFLRRAVTLTEVMLRLFEDAAGGGLFDTTGSDRSLLVRMKEHHDGAEPAGSSVAVWNLLRLAELTDRHEWRLRAERILSSEGKLLRTQPVTLPLMAGAIGALNSSPLQMYILGRGDDQRTTALRDEVFSRFLPYAVIHLIEPGEQQQDLQKLLPFAGTLSGLNGEPTAFVCRNFSCELPTTNADELGKKLEGD